MKYGALHDNTTLYSNNSAWEPFEETPQPLPSTKRHCYQELMYWDTPLTTKVPKLEHPALFHSTFQQPTCQPLAERKQPMVKQEQPMEVPIVKQEQHILCSDFPDVEPIDFEDTTTDLYRTAYQEIMSSTTLSSPAKPTPQALIKGPVTRAKAKLLDPLEELPSVTLCPQYAPNLDYSSTLGEHPPSHHQQPVIQNNVYNHYQYSPNAYAPAFNHPYLTYTGSPVQQCWSPIVHSSSPMQGYYGTDYTPGNGSESSGYSSGTDVSGQDGITWKIEWDTMEEVTAQEEQHDSAPHHSADAALFSSPPSHHAPPSHQTSVEHSYHLRSQQPDPRTGCTQDFKNIELEEVLSLLKSVPTSPPPKPKRKRNDSEEEDNPSKKNRKNCPEPRRYPTNTVGYLSHWFCDNLHHPYPTVETKKDLMMRTGLSRCQIRQWFTNARRRYLKSGKSPVRMTRME